MEVEGRCPPEAAACCTLQNSGIACPYSIRKRRVLDVLFLPDASGISSDYEILPDAQGAPLPDWQRLGGIPLKKRLSGENREAFFFTFLQNVIEFVRR